MFVLKTNRRLRLEKKDDIMVQHLGITSDTEPGVKGVCLCV